MIVNIFVRIFIESSIQILEGNRHGELCSWFELQGTEDQSGEEKVGNIQKGMVVFEFFINGEVVVTFIDFHADILTFLTNIIIRTVTIGHILVIEAGASVET